MIECVMFDFDHLAIFYRDGVVDYRMPYYWDYFEDRYTYDEMANAMWHLVDGIRIYHLDYRTFVDEAGKLEKWDWTFVLELARAKGEVES